MRHQELTLGGTGSEGALGVGIWGDEEDIVTWRLSARDRVEP